MSFEDCLGSCSVYSSVQAAQESCVAGTFDKNAMQDPTNTNILQFESVAKYNDYVSLTSYLIPVVVIAPIVLNVLLDLMFMYEPCYGKKTSDRLSIIRDKHWFRGFGLFIGSLTASILLLTGRWTGLDIGNLLSLDGTPNLYYSVQLLICQWLMAQSLVCLAFSYRKVSIQCTQAFVGIVTTLLAVSYWLFIEPVDDENTKVVGVLLLLTSAAIYVSESTMMEWWYKSEASMPVLVDCLVVNKKHPAYLHDSAQYDAYRVSKLYKKKHAKIALKITNRKLAYLFVADVLFLVGNSMQFSRDASDSVRMSVIQVDEWRCGTYWPLLFLVTFGFIIIAWGLLAVVAPVWWSVCCAQDPRAVQKEACKVYACKRTEAAQKHRAWSMVHPMAFSRLIDCTELEPVSSSVGY